MTALRDLTGQSFERLTVLCRAPNSANDRVRWWCECICGAVKLISRDTLLSGSTKSCGCLLRESWDRRKVIHRKSDIPEYRIFYGMKTRCTNVNRKQAADYVGRGIQLLFQSFEDFYQEVGPRPSPQHSIERINNNGHYAPGKCLGRKNGFMYLRHSPSMREVMLAPLHPSP